MTRSGRTRPPNVKELTMVTKKSLTMSMLAVLAAATLSTAAVAQTPSRIRVHDHRTKTPSGANDHDHRGEKPSGTTTRGGTQVPPPRRSVSNRSVRNLPNTAPNLPQQPMKRVRHVKKGGWRTLENYWNTKADIAFDRPAGATVKIRYGSTKKYFGKDRQKQRIEANKGVVLKVGSYSAVRARVQIYVERDTDVTYYVYLGGVNSVTIPF